LPPFPSPMLCWSIRSFFRFPSPSLFPRHPIARPMGSSISS